MCADAGEQMGKIRVVVADGHEFTREAYSSVLSQRSQVEVVDSVADGRAAVEAVDEHRADVALIDIDMPLIDGVQTAREIKARNPDVGIVLLSATDDPSTAAAFMRDDPRGKAFLRKSAVSSASELVRAITTVAQGRTMLDGTVIQALSSQQHAGGGPLLERLTPRELQILSAIACGATNATIADRLHLAPRTVENYIGSIFAKLGIRPGGERHSRVQAALLYLRSTGYLQAIDLEEQVVGEPVLSRAF